MNNFFKIVLVFNFHLTIFRAFGNFQYPAVRRNESIQNDFWGTIVVDAYRWLEDPESEETKQFVDQQNEPTHQYIATNQYRDDISKIFTNLYDYPKYGVPSKRGSKYFFWQNSGLQDQNVIYSADTLDSVAQVFIDPNTLSIDGTVSLTFTSYSPDGKYCAYGLSKGGSDWISIKIRSVETGDDLSEELRKIKFATTSWTFDNLGFFYAYYDEYDGPAEGTDPITPENQKLFYHRLNTTQESDIMIVAFPQRPRWLIGTPRVSDDGKYVHIWPQEGTSATPWFYAPLDSNPITGSLTFTAITDVAEAEYYYVTSNDNICYMRTNKNASNFRLVQIDLLNPDQSNWVNILAEKSNTVLDMAVAVNQNYLAAVYLRDVVHIIEMHNLEDGRYLWDIDTPIGTVNSISATRNGSDLFYKITSFLSPGIIYQYDFNTNPNRIKLFRESRITGLDTSQFETNQVFFRSKDRTVRVPMFIVNKKNLKLDGSNPTMLYAYGGFNINIMPNYDPLASFFINNLNGVYALANIRGGGEYGESWHEAGMLDKKQNVFDDFISAAEYLIQNNYTRRDRLTINGRSNGGLLVGAVSNQRPDLFGCALANVGVMDMLRFHLFTIGYAWMEEYGNPDVQSNFLYLYKYSPLHNVPVNATQYPATLVLTADHDDRVVPAHSYKFIAELQHQLGSKLQDTPLLIRIDKDSGHGSGKPISKWIEEYTDISAFVINSLKIDYNGKFN